MDRPSIKAVACHYFVNARSLRLDYDRSGLLTNCHGKQQDPDHPEAGKHDILLDGGRPCGLIRLLIQLADPESHLLSQPSPGSLPVVYHGFLPPALIRIISLAGLRRAVCAHTECQADIFHHFS